MGSHINDQGKFQSDKYPTCPPGKVPLSVEDPLAQGLLWEYAQRRRPVDAEFSDDLEAALKAAGFTPKPPTRCTCGFDATCAGGALPSPQLHRDDCALNRFTEIGDGFCQPFPGARRYYGG